MRFSRQKLWSELSTFTYLERYSNDFKLRSKYLLRQTHLNPINSTTLEKSVRCRLWIPLIQICCVWMWKRSKSGYCDIGGLRHTKKAWVCIGRLPCSFSGCDKWVSLWLWVFSHAFIIIISQAHLFIINLCENTHNHAETLKDSTLFLV